MDAIFFLKASVPSGLPANVKGIQLDPVAYGFACGGADKYCSTAYSQLWQHLGGPTGSVIANLKKKYGIDGKVSFVGFSAAHGFLNPLLAHESPDAVVLVDATFGGGKDGYIKAAKAAAVGGPLLVSVTSDKGSTDALNNGDYAWRKFVLEPAGVTLSPAASAMTPPPSKGVSKLGNLWYYRYSDAELHHWDMGKILPSVVKSVLLPYLSGAGGGPPKKSVWPLVFTLAGAYLAWRAFSRRAPT